MLFSQYGGTGAYPLSNMATFAQELAWSDGELSKYTCSGIIRVLNQEGAAWSGRAERSRGRPDSACYSTGEMAGELHMDGSIHFTLTQEQWSFRDPAHTQPRIDCTALGSGEYTGMLDKNRFYATGATRLRCDDGREATVTETMFGDHQAPGGSHDT